MGKVPKVEASTYISPFLDDTINFFLADSGAHMSERVNHCTKTPLSIYYLKLIFSIDWLKSSTIELY
jgi:hypothetical protein